MVFNNDRGALREQFFTAWHKYQHKQLLTALEQQLVRVIQDHPEYQDSLNHPEHSKEQDFDSGEINPFLHMAMHLAIRDQLTLDQPMGVRVVFDRLLLTLGDPLAVEHEMMRILTDHIWIMLKQPQQQFDSVSYLAHLQQLL